MNRFVSAFRRVTPSGRYIAELDGLRFLAIAAVFLYHVAGYVAVKTGGHEPPAYWRHLSYGVQVFFAISGFILALPFTDPAKAPQIGQYLMRRVQRIEPPYIINILAVAAISTNLSGENIMAALTYSNGLVFGRTNPLSVVSWSLEVEVQFYLLGPLLFRAFRLAAATRRTLFVVLAALAVAAQVLIQDPRVGLTLLGHAQYFLAGALLADIYASANWAAAPQLLRWDLVGLFAWLGLLAAIDFGGHVPSFAGAPLVALAAAAAFRGKLTRKALSAPAISTIGGMCYTLYLYHYFIISAAGRFSLPYSHSIWVQSALIAVPALSVCGVLFLLFERPFMRSGWSPEFRPAAPPGSLFANPR